MSKVFMSVQEDRQYLTMDSSLIWFDKLLEVVIGRKSPSLAQEVWVDAMIGDPDECELLGGGRAQ